MPDIIEFQQAYEQCDQAEIQKFENEFLANHEDLSDSYAEVRNQVDGRSLSELFQSYQPERSINGSEIVDRLRSQAENKIMQCDDPLIGTYYIDNPQKDFLLKAADQLEQYLKDLGTNGMCSDEDLKMFWQDSRMTNGSDVIDRLRSSAEAMDEYITTYDGMSYGENPQRKSILEAADKLEQYVNDLQTDGMCSNEDLQIFWKNFSSEDGNPYQATQATLNHMESQFSRTGIGYGQQEHPSVACGGCHGYLSEEARKAWAGALITGLSSLAGSPLGSIGKFIGAMFGFSIKDFVKGWIDSKTIGAIFHGYITDPLAKIDPESGEAYGYDPDSYSSDDSSGDTPGLH